ncbi:hypothetical protein SADUNF_Sadunf05G0091900 [Salix dunnii]|uniref:ATPase family AAA domain-containing protein n=1 Tax=Salix dunnii TaxID=1413687 RepID=A0A835K396_9ROSI|nr:hypothetical protein SADUNF_Sadunf05G0091900 [Salix dunnii]
MSWHGKECRQITMLRGDIMLNWLRCRKSLQHKKNKRDRLLRSRSRLNNVRLRKRAGIEQETIRVKAMVEAEGQDIEVTLSEEYNRQMLIERINGEREKWLAAINSTLSHIEGGFRTLLTDQSKLIMTVGGATTLATGIYITRRNSMHMSEAHKNALNALLFGSGDQSKDIVRALATNNAGGLDSAITDRINEVIELPLPGYEEQFKLLSLHQSTYLSSEGNNGSSRGSLFKSVQAAVYRRSECVLDSQLFIEIVDYKVAEHKQRLKLAAEAGPPSLAGEYVLQNLLP